MKLIEYLFPKPVIARMDIQVHDTVAELVQTLSNEVRRLAPEIECSVKCNTTNYPSFELSLNAHEAAVDLCTVYPGTVFDEEYIVTCILPPALEELRAILEVKIEFPYIRPFFTKPIQSFRFNFDATIPEILKYLSDLGHRPYIDGYREYIKTLFQPSIKQSSTDRLNIKSHHIPSYESFVDTYEPQFKLGITDKEIDEFIKQCKSK